MLLVSVSMGQDMTFTLQDRAGQDRTGVLPVSVNRGQDMSLRCKTGQGRTGLMLVSGKQRVEHDVHDARQERCKQEDK